VSQPAQFPSFSPLPTFSVRANSPADLSVLCSETPCLAPSISAGGGSSNGLIAGYGTRQVPITPPGANFWYVVVYFDVRTGDFGTVYGGSNPPQFLVLPDSLAQVPVAVVLTSYTDTAILNSQIIDLRGAGTNLFPCIFSVGAGTSTVNCHGAAVIAGSSNFNSTLVINLTNLRVGAVFACQLYNSSGSSQLWTINATTPSGVSFAVQGKLASNANSLTLGSQTALANTTVMLTGVASNSFGGGLSLLLNWN